jgi:replicative DNA helicase
MNDIEEIEKTILGSILFNPPAHMNVFTKLKSEHFTTYNMGCIFKAMESLNASGSPIDLVMVSQELKLAGKLESVGAYNVAALTDHNTFQDLTTHCLLLLEDYLKRELSKIAVYLQNRTRDFGVDIFDLIDETEGKLTNLIKGVIPAKIDAIEPIKNKVLDEIQAVLHSGKRSGITCSIDRLNNQTNGWQKTDLIIIAGRPGMGKTSAALDFALIPAMQGTPTAFFSLEMSKEQLTSRALSILSGIDVQKIVNKTVNHGEYLDLEDKGETLKGVPLFIDDTPAITIFDLKNRARVLKRENKIELIIVDYLQLMSVSYNSKSGNREQEISEISRGLKALAKELDLPIIALSQLSRQSEGRQDKKPILSDLRESGAIEQDADMVVFCHRPEYYGITEYEIGTDRLQTEGLFIFIIAKFRNGSPGEVRARFIHSNTKVTNWH